MANRHENYRQMLDSLLAAGNKGEPLQDWHLPHLREARMKVTLPPVLDPSCCHVAEISFRDGKLRYKEVLSQAEAGTRHDLSLLPEAKGYASTQWNMSVLQFKPSVVQQTRHASGSCTWSVFEQRDMVLQTRHQSEFMELGRQCVVTYDDQT